jgi:hypothetical protein
MSLKAVLKASAQAGQSKIPKTTGQRSNQEDGFKEVRGSKRQRTDEAVQIWKTAAVPATSVAVSKRPKEVATRNFFAALWTTDIDTGTTATEAVPVEKVVPYKTTR